MLAFIAVEGERRGGSTGVDAWRSSGAGHGAVRDSRGGEEGDGTRVTAAGHGIQCPVDEAALRGMGGNGR